MAAADDHVADKFAICENDVGVGASRNNLIERFRAQFNRDDAPQLVVVVLLVGLLRGYSVRRSAISNQRPPDIDHT